MNRRIALITFATPTFNNSGAASALPYHLIKGNEQGLKDNFEVWTFNLNNISKSIINTIESELGVKIHILEIPKWYRSLFAYHLVFLRVFLHYPLLSYFKIGAKTIDEINEYNPGLIWIYGEELSGLTSAFTNKPKIVTMPDSETMYYQRVLNNKTITNNAIKRLRYRFAYWQYRSMDRKNFQKDVVYHFVGKADAEYFRHINPEANAVFLPHPHYAYRNKEIKFHSPRIRLLFAGRYDFYCQHGSDELLNEMISDEDLKEHFEITFLGKGWETWNQQLLNSGWKSNLISFAPDYIAELQKHDIQINAIDIGTGTKGKVLDAISNGLLAIGTPYALENIAVENNKSCIEYSSSEKVVEVFHDIISNPKKYEEIARDGRNKVLEEHNPMRIAAKLFSLTNLAGNIGNV